ncbi:hypothetical protein OS493_020926 [Desmophyllum pertusum]|uniref:Uncharacterized protein n=1 Tax=Desmophyllum pertusum TaxID=174260 RepID=A0A9W9ZZV7_9CNID|nr:hypothetical protein OS493_020926 [Desmophyllum pertusum]
MATQEEQKFLDHLFATDGIIPSLGVVEKVFRRGYGFTDQGKPMEQCTEENEVHFHTAQLAIRGMEAGTKQLLTNAWIGRGGYFSKTFSKRMTFHKACPM